MYFTILLFFILIFHEFKTSDLEDEIDNMINIRRKSPTLPPKPLTKKQSSSTTVKQKQKQQPQFKPLLQQKSKITKPLKQETKYKSYDTTIDQHSIHPFPLIALGKKCSVYQDCVSPSLLSSSLYKNIKIKEVNKTSWCETSGYLCLDKKCYQIPLKPCSHIEKCNEELKICEPKECTKSSDCDDGLFCNGIETCNSRGKCDTNFTLHCIGGICSETDKKCTFPSLYSQWNRFKNKVMKVDDSHYQQHFISSYYNNEFSIKHWSNSSTTTLNQTELTVIIVVAIVIVSFILIFLMIAVIGRPFSTTTINTNGGGGNSSGGNGGLYTSSTSRYDGEY